jgi:hypothetical protein
MNMKSILMETFSVIEVSLFWAVALPAAAFIFPIVADWQKLCSLIAQGPIAPRRSFGSQPKGAAR